MASSLISTTFILFFLHSSFIILICAKPTFNATFVTNQAERLVKSLNLSPKKPVNIINDTSIKPAELLHSNFSFLDLLSFDDSIQNLGHHAGYIPIKHSYNARMFYYFFQSRSNKSDPVVLWLTGGPGCGSELALFYENGPFKIDNNLSLKWNDFGWDKASNLLFVDQPIGTGFSYTSDERDIRHNGTAISDDLYDFLQEFFKAHPDFVKNDFYITGESYAGHYIPALGSRVQKGNKAKDGTYINLKGIAIGNGLTDPEYQYPAYPDYALANKLISQSNCNQLKKYVPQCVKAIQKCQTNDYLCQDASFYCDGLFEDILPINPNINFYDIRKHCNGQLCYDFSNLEKFFILDSVKKALGIGNITFVSCSTTVYNALAGDQMKDYEPMIPSLLEDGIKVLIYAGEFDLLCNWLGNFNWVNAMKWSGQEQFAKANLTSYVVARKNVGDVKSYGPLTFLKVHKAGHMVPMDTPKVSLQMLKNWMSSSTSQKH